MKQADATCRRQAEEKSNYTSNVHVHVVMFMQSALRNECPCHNIGINKSKNNVTWQGQTVSIGLC